MMRPGDIRSGRSRAGAALAVVAAVALAVGLLLPSRARDVPVAGAPAASVVRGAIHVHSRRSDGTGTRERIAAAAARADLQFVVVTDHGDGTRHPEPPQYLSGVLAIDAVEITTEAGHAVAIGLPQAPYRLGGEPRDVVEDIARLGGVSIAAHPGSAKPGLRWRDWAVPFDGLEWLNGDSEWRDEPVWSLARALLTYPARPVETLGALLDRPDEVLARWDALTARRRVVALAAADAHARLGTSTEPYEGAALLRAPGYEQMFRAFSVSLPGLALSGDPAADAGAVVQRLRDGNAYSSIGALAAPAQLSFSATGAAGRVDMGGELAGGTPFTVHAAIGGPPDARIVLIRDGRPIESASGRSVARAEAGEPGVYRVEVFLPGAPGTPPVPWIVSNPIYVRAAAPSIPPTPPLEPSAGLVRYGDGPADGLTIERSPRADGVVDVVPALAGTQLKLRYALGGAESESPYVALVVPVAAGILAGYDRVRFSARAARPMRLSVQVRVPDAAAGERWHRSVYVDDTPRDVTVAFDDMSPRGAAGTPRPRLPDVRDVLFVIDTVNTRPGVSGEVWLDDLRFERTRQANAQK